MLSWMPSQISLGRVSTRRTVMKSTPTISSKLTMKAKTAPAITPGLMIGKVTSRKVDQPDAPRFFAACSSRGSKPASAAVTFTSTKGDARVACAMAIPMGEPTSPSGA